MPSCYYCGTVLEEHQLQCSNCGKMVPPAPEEPKEAVAEASTEPNFTLGGVLDSSDSQNSPANIPSPSLTFTPPAAPEVPSFTTDTAPTESSNAAQVPPPPAAGHSPWEKTGYAYTPPPENPSQPGPAPSGAWQAPPPPPQGNYAAQPGQGAYPPPPGPPPSSAGYGPLYDPEQMADIEKNKNMAILAYLGVLILVPAISAQHSPYAKFHVNQALVLLICEVILSVASSLLGYFLLYIPTMIVCIALLVFWIMGIYNAATGKFQPLPLIGTIQLVKY
ncbi:hypothetical protein LJC49_00910 [Ruminococcaceae bacterium OttesenSCG-928-I18]|nr:hypothetical protein [Ruminococcaceae bacterium OttesenSCG-928-I18]